MRPQRLLSTTLLLLLAGAAGAAASPGRLGRPGANRPVPPAGGIQRPAGGQASLPADRPQSAPARPQGAADRAAARDAVTARLPQPNGSQQTNLDALHGDLQAIGGGLKNAQGQIQALGQDLKGMGLQRPDSALTKNLATSLQSALADASLSPKEYAELTQDLYAVMNSAGLSADEFAVIQNDVAAILTTSGVDSSDVQAVVGDLQAIYQTAQGNHPQ